MGTDPPGGGISVEVIIIFISGLVDQVTDFFAEVLALLESLVLAYVQLSLNRRTPTYPAWRRT